MLKQAVSFSVNFTKCLYSYQPQRLRGHLILKFREHRRRKVQPIDLIDFEKRKRESELSPDELRIKMKKEGKMPPRTFDERPINISSTGAVMDMYVPPEGDGQLSTISKEGVKDKYSDTKRRVSTLLAIRKLKKYEEDFKMKNFIPEAQNIYIESQNLLNNLKENEEKLHELVTDKAYVEMVYGLDKKTFRWKFIESIEPPKAVHVRTTDLLSKDNLYSQITIRFFTRQTLAMYDQFGRLMYGSEHLVKDVLEYVVFEKHISNIYGQWRVHGKIIPDWLPQRDDVLRTYRLPPDDSIEDEVIVEADSMENEVNVEPDSKENEVIVKAYSKQNDSQETDLKLTDSQQTGSKETKSTAHSTDS